jgi:tetratricopeptide (TPR) repeat protein
MTAPPALLVTGEAGVGKSRLIAEAADAAGAHCAECRCSRYHETTSLYAFRPVLEAACDIAEHDEPAARLSKLRARLGALDANGADLPFLTAALQIPSSDIMPPPDVDPTRLRELALEAAVQLVCAHLEGGPSILFVDDVHWADQSTLDLISALLPTPRPGLVVMLAARDGFDPPWPATYLERLQLAPLTGDELEEMAGLMPEASRLSAEERDALIERCDGMPLFLEELVRTAEGLDQGRVAFHSINWADFRIPPALRDPLLARLTSPGVDLELAQAAATIGREAERDLLRRVTGLSQRELDRRLHSLIDADLVHPHGGDAVRFRHELIREVAYETQGLAARREYHGRIADELLRTGVPSVRSDAWEAAFHLERARRYSEAIEARVGAAQRNQELGAHTEAMAELARALDLLVHLPEGPEREHTELMVRELRSFSAVMAAGYAAPEAAEDHGRCVELCEGFGLPPELLPSLIRSWSFYAFRGEIADAERVCDAMEQVASTGALAFPAEAIGRGLTEFFRGNFGEARRLMESFVQDLWGDTPARPPAEWPLPNDALAAVYGHLVLILWICGERRAAYAMGERGLRRAEDLGFPYGPFTTAYINSLLALTRRIEGDHQGATTSTQEMLDLAERHGFAFFAVTGMLHRALDRAYASEAGAIEELRGSVDVWRHVVMGEAYSPWALVGLADAEAAAGRIDDALGSLDQALAVAAATGSEFYSAEALRRRGVLRANAGDAGGIADIENALDMARRQQARAFELRAAMALARTPGHSDPGRAAVLRALDGIPPDPANEDLREARSLVGL